MSDVEHEKTRIRTADAELEPEVVGFHSGVPGGVEQCENRIGEFVEDIRRCENKASHTCVVKDGSGLTELAMCDKCGEPDAVNGGRRWSDS